MLSLFILNQLEKNSFKASQTGWKFSGLDKILFPVEIQFGLREYWESYRMPSQENVVQFDSHFRWQAVDGDVVSELSMSTTNRHFPGDFVCETNKFSETTSLAPSISKFMTGTNMKGITRTNITANWTSLCAIWSYIPETGTLISSDDLGKRNWGEREQGTKSNPRKINKENPTICLRKSQIFKKCWRSKLDLKFFSTKTLRNDCFNSKYFPWFANFNLIFSLELQSYTSDKSLLGWRWRNKKKQASWIRTTMRPVVTSTSRFPLKTNKKSWNVSKVGMPMNLNFRQLLFRLNKQLIRSLDGEKYQNIYDRFAQSHFIHQRYPCNFRQKDIRYQFL